MIEINNVTKRFDDILAVNNISLTIADSFCTSIVAPNGAKWLVPQLIKKI